MFDPPVEQPGKRICSTCEELKTVDNFYKDGHNSAGEPKYRRDCKDCYRVTRLKSRRGKRK